MSYKTNDEEGKIVPKKITVLAGLESLNITNLQAKVLSEITRFTMNGNDFFKGQEKFAQELGCCVGHLKDTLTYLSKKEWIGRERRLSGDKREFLYFATQKIIDIAIKNLEKIESRPQKKRVVISEENRNKILGKIRPKTDRKQTENRPKTDRNPIGTPASSSVEAPNKLSNILNNECIKELKREKKENTVDFEVQSKTPNTTKTLNINSLSNFFGLSQEEKEDMDIYRNLNTLLLFLSKKSLSISDLEEIKANTKQEDFEQNKFKNLNWGGWIKIQIARKSEKKLKQFTITKDPNFGKTKLIYEEYLFNYSNQYPDENAKEFTDLYYF